MTVSVTEVPKQKKQLALHAHPGRVIVVEDDPVKKVGRIIIPDDRQTRPSMGTVADIGPNTETSVKIGEHICYPMYSGTALKLKSSEKRFRVLSPSEILCTIDEGEEVEETGA